MIRAIIKFWPVIVPIVLYLIWLIFFRKNSGLDADELSKKQSRLWILALSSSLVIAVICIAILVFSTESNKDSIYIPPQYKDGQLIPAQIIPKQKND